MPRVCRLAATAAPLLLLIVLAVPRAAQAQLRLFHRSWEVSFFGGGSFLGDRRYPTDVAGPSPTGARNVGLRYGSGYVVGASVTENRWRHVGATFEYTFANQPLEFAGLLDQPESLGLSHSVHRVAYELAYYPLDPHSRLRPYAFAGPGLSLFRVARKSIAEGSASETRVSDPWKFTVNWGGGVKYLLVDHWAASLQFTDSVSGVPGYGLRPTAYAAAGALVPGFRPNGFLHDKIVTLGIVYQWDDR